MANSLPVFTADPTPSQDGNVAEQTIASGIDAKVPLAKLQPIDEHAVIIWFQHQQAQDAARFPSPSFREG